MVDVPDSRGVDAGAVRWVEVDVDAGAVRWVEVDVDVDVLVRGVAVVDVR